MAGLVPPRSLWVGPNDPLIHFLRWGIEYRAYLTLLCDLRRDSRVLELGCHHGRLALALIDYLIPNGVYDGFDISRAAIRFATEHIEEKYPNFRFTWVDVYNSLYNPSGALAAENFDFPYPSNRFDVMFAASLFTHMLPNDVSRYLKEARRTAVKGAKALFSLFVLDYYSGPKTTLSTLYEFNHRLKDYPGVAVHDAGRPEQLIAYSLPTFADLAAAAQWKVVKILPGIWSQSTPVQVNEQDLVVLEAV